MVEDDFVVFIVDVDVPIDKIPYVASELASFAHDCVLKNVSSVVVNKNNPVASILVGKQYSASIAKVEPYAIYSNFARD
jgi:hypothetical protein